MTDERINNPEGNPTTMVIGKTEYIIHSDYSGKVDISKKIKDLILREIEREMENKDAFQKRD